MTDAEGPTDASLESLPDRISGVLTALNTAEVGIFILGSDFSVEWMNETAAKYFGLDRADAIGEDKPTLIDSTIRSAVDDSARFAETVLGTYEDNTYVEEFECHILPGDNREERWLLHQSQPIETGAFAGGRVEHYIDITERKNREQELQRERDRLDEFAGVVSHDLRNPLHVATGRLELVQEECNSTHLGSIETALKRMERIIDDVLWLAREGRNIGSMDTVVLRDMMDTAWDMVADRTEHAELHYAGDGFSTATVEADADRLCQLFENLFRNAIDHGGEDVTVTVGTVDDGFFVEDDGPGIPDDRRDEVFTAGHSTGEDGSGFGLSIVKQVVDAHDWEIHLTESAEGGARFEVTDVEFAANSVS